MDYADIALGFLIAVISFLLGYIQGRTKKN